MRSREREVFVNIEFLNLIKNIIIYKPKKYIVNFWN